MTCGCSYQIIHGTEEQEKEGNYPYLSVKKSFVPALKEYWEETHKFVFSGMSFSENTGLEDFWKWIEQKHPELLKDEENGEGD